MIFLNKKNYCVKRLFQMIGITFLLFLSTASKAQVTKDTTRSKTQIADTTSVIKKYHSPKKAAIFSTVLPGLGQVYNKKYWKVPVIYAGFAGLAYSINFNQTRYVRYRNAYKDRLDNDPLTNDIYIGKYSDDNLNTLQKYYHRYRDLSVIGASLLYIINIVDASVDAHLFTFDVTDDLSLNIHPTWITTAYANHYTTGLSLSIKF
jgi:hypothetical protein